jgi:hypothetical protein
VARTKEILLRTAAPVKVGDVEPCTPAEAAGAGLVDAAAALATAG